MAAIDYKELKKGGFMRQVQNGHFSMRLRSVAGEITAAQLRKIYEIAEKYGQGYIHLTSRQGIEIPFIKFEDISEVRAEMAKVGLEPGACGPRVRTVTACQGGAICPSGLIETTMLAKELDRKYFGRELPHKFKIGITGCPNNCLKAEENDLGIKGGLEPHWHKDNCTFCGLCQAVCPGKAITVQKQEKTLDFNAENCTNCGRCVKSCPSEAWEGQAGYLIYCGGTFGNEIVLGRRIFPMIYSLKELFDYIDKALDFFQKYGKPGERFRVTIERIGWDVFRDEVRSIQEG